MNKVIFLLCGMIAAGTLLYSQSSIWSVSFSPDGRQVVSGGSGGTMKFWDAATGQETHSFRGHSSAVYSVAFSPDNRYVVSGSQDGIELQMVTGYRQKLNGNMHAAPERQQLTILEKL